MVRRHLASLWSLPDGTRCDLILLSTANGIPESGPWQLEVIRGADRLYCEGFETVPYAYAAAQRWLQAAGGARDKARSA